MTQASRNAHDAVELELIRSLSAGWVPSVIMSLGFAIAGSLIVWAERDLTLFALLICGLLASAARISVALRMPRRRGCAELAIERARKLERVFRNAYLAFALVLGLFGLRTFMLPMPAVHMLMLCLLIGYAAGVSATIAMRPRIAIPSMLLALTPALGAALLRFDPLYAATALMTSAFLAGGIHNLRLRHRHAVEEISMRITFGNIARKDSLTALPNRIALREWFQERSAASDAGSLISVHYLDLDGFKPINDRFGHPIGDALLAAVGKRIVGAIRETDLAARLGGDEFAVVQFGIDNSEDAERLARRLIAAISRPYNIEERIVSISTSIGYAIAHPRAADLEELLAHADRALYTSKRQGGGITRHDPASGKSLDAAA